MATELREIDISNYWPPVVRDTAEFQQIANALNPEFNDLQACIYRALQDSFVQDATEYGVKRWENILKISPESGDTLEVRKERILTYLNVKLPYTWRVLKQMLIGLLGEENFNMTFDNDTSTLKVALALDTTQAQVTDVQTLLDRVLPRNLVTEIDPFPCDFTRVEYLESTGTQYIDTAWILKEENNYSFELTLGHVGWKDWAWFYGIRDESTGTTYSISANYNFNASHETPSLQLTYGAIAEMHFIAFTVHYGEDTRIVYENSANTIIFNEGTKTNSTVFENPHDLPFYLFATKRIKSSGATDRLTSKVRIGYFKAKDNLMEMNMVAALDSTGTPCMFDTVSKTPFYNSGTGDFLYPGAEQAVQTLDLDLDAKSYAKLTEYGVRRLYHVPKGYNGTKEEYAAANGFKELVEPQMPLEGYWTPEWRETDTQLICDWLESEPPTEEVIENE